MNEQQSETATAVQAPSKSSCPHPEVVGKRWGDPISAKRQAELQAYLDNWAAETDHGERTGAFDRWPHKFDVPLTGAEVFWLAVQSGSKEYGRVPDLHLEGANLNEAHLEGAMLGGAHLDNAALVAAHLEGANLIEAHLEVSHFDDAHLEGAKLGGAHLERARFSAAHLEGTNFNEAHLEGANLSRANLGGARLEDTHLEGANLNDAHLERASAHGAHLEHASLHRAHLERARFSAAHLEGTVLEDAHLENALLEAAHLEGAALRRAHLDGADLWAAHLEGASLYRSHLLGTGLRAAHLDGADLHEAHLEGANLTGVWLDSKTELSDATLDLKTRLGDIQWSGVGAVNLTRINWDRVPTLGDEQGVGLRAKATEYEAVVRAYRQLAAQLRAQGMSEVADRFLYRAQMWQRRVLLRRGRLLQYVGSWFLDLISGYGYKPMRSLITYVLVILAFAAAYFALGGANGQPLSWNEAVVISMTAFHGRGFFSSVFQPGDLQAAVAAVEAFIGLLIEIVFIATFTQRFFAR